MSSEPCENCKKLLDGETHKRHEGLQRDGLYKAVGYHGNRDDEYYYICKVCGSRFIGDSCGTWPDRD